LHEALSCSQKAEEDDNELIEEDSNELIAELLNQPETHDQNNGGNAQLRTSDEHFREFFGDDALAPEEEEEFERVYTTQILDADSQPIATPISINQAHYDKALFAAIRHGSSKELKEALGAPENPKGNPYAVNSAIKGYKNMTVLMAALKKGNGNIVAYLIRHYPDHNWQADDGAGNTVKGLADMFKQLHNNSTSTHSNLRELKIADYIIAKCRFQQPQEVLSNNGSNAQLRTSDEQFRQLFGDDALASEDQPALVITPKSNDQARYDRALFTAIRHGSTKDLEKALGTPENPKGNPYAVSHTKNYKNMTVLMAALEEGNGNMVTYLVEHCPDHNWRADDGAGNTVKSLASLFKQWHSNYTRQNVRALETADYIIAKCRQQELMPPPPGVLLNLPLLSEEEDTRIPGTITAIEQVPLSTILRKYS